MKATKVLIVSTLVLVVIVLGYVLFVIRPFQLADSPVKNVSKQSSQKIYANQFISFIYPNYYTIKTDKVVADHEPRGASGYESDKYGFVGLTLELTDDPTTYASITRLPLKPDTPYKSTDELFDRTRSDYQQEKYVTVTKTIVGRRKVVVSYQPVFGELDAERKWLTGTGYEKYEFINQGNLYSFELYWGKLPNLDDPMNQPDNPVRVDFKSLVASLKVDGDN